MNQEPPGGGSANVENSGASAEQVPFSCRLADDEAPAGQGCAVTIDDDDLPGALQLGRQPLGGMHAPTIAPNLERNDRDCPSFVLPAVRDCLAGEITELRIEHQPFLLPRTEKDGRGDRIALRRPSGCECEQYFAHLAGRRRTGLRRAPDHGRRLALWRLGFRRL